MRHFLFISISILLVSPNLQAQQSSQTVMAPEISSSRLYTDSRPWTRWWWFASEIKKSDIADNLTWLKDNGFGGVEIAWVYPLNRMKKDTVHYTPRQAWLSPEWSAMVAYAKHCADSLGMGCDFTFGSLWPFGDTQVPRAEATRNMTDTGWRQEITASWDYPGKGYVIDHLDRRAFDHYAERTGDALEPALAGSASGLFCDSWEVDTKYLTTDSLPVKFAERYGYDLLKWKDSLYSNSGRYPQVRYDYMKLISDMVIGEFYQPFTNKCHELGAYSRVQCSGAPCDIIAAYATADIPESEALLYEPAYSNIVASAAALSGKRVVTAETFTCLYGWPRDHQGKEQTADLKLLADALFANGVNHIIWHGKPFNPAGMDTVKFYATVHVGKTGPLARELPEFNRYLEKVSIYMKMGRPITKVAVFLPLEDAWIDGEMPVDKQFIWAWGEYEMRYTRLPQELKPWRPMWINTEFLEKASYRDGRIEAGDLSFEALYVDVRYLDIRSLKRITELAVAGFPVYIRMIPRQPGFDPDHEKYDDLLNQLVASPGYHSVWMDTGIDPVVTGLNDADFWCRESEDGMLLFIANPKSSGLTFPLAYGQSLDSITDSRMVTIHYQGMAIPYKLVFSPYQSVLLRVTPEGKVLPVDLHFKPQTPVFEPRVRQGREKWEVSGK